MPTIANALFLWMHLQDKRQVDGVARFSDIPTDAETAGCPMRVAISVIIGTHAVVAVLHGQVVGSTVGCDIVGEKGNGLLIPLPTIRDRDALPPPFGFVVAPHLHEGCCHLHACCRRREDDSTPVQVSCPIQGFHVAVFVQ